MSTNPTEPPGPPRRSSGAKTHKVLLALAALLLGLAAGEGFLRAVHRPLDWEPGYDVLGRGWSRGLHQRSSVPGLDYELKPNLDATVFGVEVRTNRLGMRSPEITIEKPDGVRRIAALGDSVTFGWGVRQDQTWPRVLERRLNADGPRFQVIDMAVSGYNSRDEATLFLARGAPLNPDLIVIGYVLNDPDIYPTQPLRLAYLRPAWWQHSSLLRLARKLLWKYDIWKYGGGDYVRYLHRDPACRGSVIDSFRELAQWAGPRGVPVAVMIFPELSVSDGPAYPYADVHEQVAHAARADGFAALDLYPVFAAHPRAVLTISADDPHPSAFAHELTGRALESFIRGLEPGLFRK